MITPDPLFDVSGQHVVITGGSGGLGSAIASGFATRGAKVCITSRTKAKADEVARRIGPNCHGLVLDVEHADSIAAFVAELGQLFPVVNTLINAAGGNRSDATVKPDASPFGISPAAIESLFRSNYLGPVSLLNAVAPRMIDAGNALVSFINVGSMSGMIPLTRVGYYSAAKAALHNTTLSLANELARRHGDRVRVNAIAPGFFPADQNMALLFADEARTVPTPRGEDIIRHTPMGRFGKPEELVGACIFLASEASRFVTGQVLAVDGGFIASTI